MKGGAPWPNPRFTEGTGAEADCITDNLTGLMWPKDGNLPAATKQWADAITYANGLTYCGHSDWRLPNRTELRSLVNYGQSNNAAWLSEQGFTVDPTASYWSATNYALIRTVLEWAIRIGSGEMIYYDKIYSHCVWPVRAGQ